MGLPSSYRAAAVGVDTSSKNFNEGSVYFLQQGVAVFAQGSSNVTYSTDKLEITSHQQAGAAFGYGSPAHLCAKELLPDNGDGALGARITIYPLPNEAAGVAAAGAITPTGTQTTAAEYTVRIGGVESESFVASVGDTATELVPKIITAINGTAASDGMPAIATDGTTEVIVTAKHKGVSGNDLTLEIIGTTAGVTFGLTQFTGGLVDPDISSATDQFGEIWETIIINALGESALDDLRTFGEGRWGSLVKKPLHAYYGSAETDVNTLKAVGDSRESDRINGVIPCPGSVSAPWVIASRAVARIAKQANENPALEYRRMELDTLVPGTDGQQWDYTTRDTAWKSGISSTQLRNSVITLDNTLTFYHPEGEPNPYYGKAVYITKLQQVLYNVDLIFDQDAWVQAALIPDGQVSTNVGARTPSDAVAVLNTLTDNLAKNAIISDPDFTKENTTASIDSSNPNRVNIVYPVKLSGNWDINSIDLQFGFYLGDA